MQLVKLFNYLILFIFIISCGKLKKNESLNKTNKIKIIKAKIKIKKKIILDIKI